MGKKIKIDENIEQELISEMLCEVFYPKAEKVLLVKDYLDKNFARQEMDDIDTNGYPKKDKVVVMLSKDKQPLKTLTPSQLLILLDDKFNSMITDDGDRKRFLKQVIVDWYGNKISKQGLLTANFL